MAKATKAQKATALAALTGDPTTSTLAKAGVEVKLTKGEIAEYISTKAITTIEKEIETLRERILKLDVYTPVDSFPKRFKPVIAALNALSDEVTYGVILAAHCNREGKSEYSWKICHSMKDYRGNPAWNSVLSYSFKEGDTLTPEIQEWENVVVRKSELEQKLYTLRQKNYKVLLVESILSGSVAGTTVLTDLNKMVEQMVAAPAGQ